MTLAFRRQPSMRRYNKMPASDKDGHWHQYPRPPVINVSCPHHQQNPLTPPL